MTTHDDALPARFTLDEIAAFLDGSDALDGVWFGEPHPTERGAYWWRKHLRDALAARGGQPVALRFPTMLRKMWSGGEVQAWLDAQGPLYAAPPAPSHEAMRGAIVAMDGVRCAGLNGGNVRDLERAIDALRAALGKEG